MYSPHRLSICVVRFIATLLIALLSLQLLQQSRAVVAQNGDPCAAPTNEVVAENCLPGQPPSDWEVSGAGDTTIQGFATDISVNQGEIIEFKINTPATDYRLDIYRLGYYGGDGARRVATVQPDVTLPQTQPACLEEPATGLIDCGNWAVSATWTVPTDATSGVYLAKAVREDTTSDGSHIVFIVRGDDGNSDLLFQTADTTWQAYNRYGGNSLYVGGPGTSPDRAYAVSYNRPFTTREYASEDWLFNAEYPMLRWLEANGYDVSYFTGVDTHRHGAELLEHPVFLSVGHDEYWSGPQRANVEAARDAGVHLAFFSGNEIFWKTRWQASIDASSTPYRTLVSYKETHADAKIDPATDTWTGTWRDPRPFNPEGPQPENALTGTLFMVNCCSYAMQVLPEEGQLRFWRHTDIATNGATLPDGTLGYEWDEVPDNAFSPPGLIRLSSTTVEVPQYLQDYGSDYAPGTATHHLTLYRAESDALVFGAGTIQWPWGLDSHHDRGSAAPDPRMQQATVNLFADMGVQPATLDPALTPATASTDTTAPTSTISDPVAGATVEQGAPVTISGTASDSEGVVGAVEVSTDGGTTWHSASGRTTWTYTWSPAATGQVTLRSRAVDDSGNMETPSAGQTVTVETRTCPCSIWNDSVVPANPNANDGQPIEVGVKFQSDVDGYITGLRFYKGSQNTGTHVGHLWTSGGNQLAEATFTGESASGWQSVAFDQPVPIEANTTYIASYDSPDGGYAYDQNYFTTTFDSPPLHALADGADGPNGVYTYGGGFPNQSFQASNYWVDVIFVIETGPDTTPPTVTSVTPANNATDVDPDTTVTATFDEPLDPATVNENTVLLRNDQGDLVPATVIYNEAARLVTLTPSAALAPSTTYAATILGDAVGVTDLAGNPLQGDYVWTFTTAAPPPPPPDEGPGGPILVVADAANPFGRYYAEILRAEGFNAFTVTDISLVDQTVLADYNVVILGEMALTAAHATLFSDWVQGGGNLIAMRPDPQLAGLLGLTDTGNDLSNAYLLIDTASGLGAGLVDETIQFHGTADLYTVDNVTVLATLYSDVTTATGNPAVTRRSVGDNGGQVAAFTYSLARSVVYTRQGNPAWAGQERDDRPPIRSDDLFYGGDDPDWVNLDKVAIPQADEQQRLLANLILTMNLDQMPLPRFWYFPRGERAIVLLTSDDHGTSNVPGRLDHYIALSPAGCSVEDWECVRASMYIYLNTALTDAQAATYTAAGFEIGLHVDTECDNFTLQSLRDAYSNQLAAFAAQFPSIPLPDSERTHCVVWSDWASQPIVKAENNIRLDTNYYYWPPDWVEDRPGFFTGSGLPMRFADTDGAMFDVYQAATQMTDESGQTYPYTINTLLDRALGPEGYYGVFTANMHSDQLDSPGADAIIAAAQARGVPIVSGRQLLRWLDGRNASSFENLSWNGNALSFNVEIGSGANGLQVMVPAQSAAGALTGITLDGGAVNYQTETTKGVTYATFLAAPGTYVASYAADITAPVISDLTATANGDGTATITWTTDEPADSRVDYGTDAGALNNTETDGALITAHSVTLTGLTPSTTYYYRVTSTDGAGNAATAPPTDQAPASFATPAAALIDTTVADFSAGTPGADIYIAAMADGEVILAPTVGSDFSGTALPAGWTSSPWTDGGAATVSGGQIIVDGARAATENYYSAGRTLEAVATFGAASFQHVGFGQLLESAAGEYWAMFSTNTTTNMLYARTNNNGVLSDVEIPGNWIGSAHRYRIEWNADSVLFYIDGTLVHTESVSIAAEMRPVASEFQSGGPTLSVDWLRMSPYAASGTFTSRIFDAGAIVDWGALTWQAELPAGASLEISVRTGDTPTPDAIWSEFQPVANSGDDVSGNSRYLQYRATLATTDPGQTPVLEQVAVTVAGTADATLVGTVTLQGRPAAPDPSWSVPLTVELYAVGGSTPVYEFTPTTDESGQFSVSGIAPGSYEIAVKHAQTLQVVETTTLAAGSSSVDFGLLLAGDANDDNVIDLLDFSLLATAFGTQTGDPEYDPRADFTGDGVIDLNDFSLLASNFDMAGEQPSGAAASSTPPGVATAAGGTVQLRAEPSTSRVGIGEEFTVTLVVEAGAQTVDAAGATVTFDPTLMQVVRVEGGEPLDTVLASTFDNAAGTMRHAAGQLAEPFASGTFPLATVTFRTVGARDGAILGFTTGTSVYRAGQNLLNTADAGEVAIADDGMLEQELDERILLPLIRTQ